MSRPSLYSLGKVEQFVEARREFFSLLFSDMKELKSWLIEQGYSQEALSLDLLWRQLIDHVVDTSPPDNKVTRLTAKTTLQSLFSINCPYHYIADFLIAHPPLLDLLTIFSNGLITEYLSSLNKAPGPMTAQLPVIRRLVTSGLYQTSEGIMPRSELELGCQRLSTMLVDEAKYLAAGDSILLKQIYYHSDHHAGYMCRQGLIKDKNCPSEQRWERMQDDLFKRMVVYRWIEQRQQEKALVKEIDKTCEDYQSYLVDQLRSMQVNFLATPKNNLTVRGGMSPRIEQIQAKYNELAALRVVLEHKDQSVAIAKFKRRFQSRDCQAILHKRCDSYIDVFMRRLSYLLRSIGHGLSRLFTPPSVQETQRHRVWHGVSDRQHLHRLKEELSSVPLRRPA